MTTKAAAPKQTIAQKLEALNTALEREMQLQKARQETAAEKLESVQDPESVKEQSSIISNANQRIKRVSKVQKGSDEFKKTLLKHFQNITDLVAPSDIYAWDTALLYIKAAENKADIKDCLCDFFVPFKRSLTITGSEIKDHLARPSSSVKGSASRWTSAPAWALEKLGAATIERNTRGTVAAVTLNPRSKLIKALVEGAYIGNLAEA